MRLGIIDLGTNSVRFDVHQIGPGKKTRCLHREKLMVRLGQGVFTDGRLDPSAIRRTLNAFEAFQVTAERLQAQKIVAFGTSALREASDSERLLTVIRERTGIDVRVISGTEEAKVIAEGILFHEKAVKPKKTYAFVDIGGGSTEISICRNGKILHSESFPLGTARLQQVFLKSSPPKPQALDELRRYIRGTVLSKVIAEEWPKADQIIGSSGTIRALAKMLNTGKTIELPALKKLVAEMSTMTTTQLLGMPRMEARRVDMVVAGAVLFEEIMPIVKAKKALITELSLRDGILHENIQLYQQNRSSAPISLHLPELYAKAERLGCNMHHVRHVAALVEKLFAVLQPLHKLKPDWKHYLTAAAILHDTGEAIGPTNHETHSYYVVKNANFPSMDKGETEFVAQLCLHHKGGKVSPKDLPFKDKGKREAYMKLLAILRLADALDRGHKASVAIKGVTLKRGEATLRVRGRGNIDLELLRVEQKKDLFESVFHKLLHVVKA